MPWLTAASRVAPAALSPTAPLPQSLDEPTTELPPRRKWAWLGRPEGPGLRESLLWFSGISLAHPLSALLMGTCILALIRAIHHQSVPFVELLQSDHLDAWFVPWLGGEQLLCLLVVLITAGRRMHLHYSLKGLTRVRPLHGVQTLLLILPMATLCSQVYLWANDYWMQWVQSYPALQELNPIQAMNVPGMLRDRASLPVVLLILAAAPAIGEELVFRGVIGRGLTHRLGMVAGVLVTSIMFGLVHMHPAHALAVIPLGIALHLVAIWTGSLWPAILMHFLNNTLAVITLMSAPLGSQGSQESQASPALLLSALGLALCLFWGMYRTRVTETQTARNEPNLTTNPRVSPVYLACFTVSFTVFCGSFLGDLFRS